MNDPVTIVTTSYHALPGIRQLAKEQAAVLECHFIDRGNSSILTLLTNYGAHCLLVYTNNGPELVTVQGRHYFHLGMAQLRIEQLDHGGEDYFAEALGTRDDASLLDCTLGFGSDAIVASFVLGKGSVITGLESSLGMATVTAWGLANFTHDNPAVTVAMRRIKVCRKNYNQYLTNRDGKKYDIIYFDPMFNCPIAESSQFKAMRPLLNHDQLTAAHIDRALAKANKRVIIKGRNFTSLQRLYPQVKIIGGTYSSIKYAVLEQI